MLKYAINFLSDGTDRFRVVAEKEVSEEEMIFYIHRPTSQELYLLSELEPGEIVS